MRKQKLYKVYFVTGVNLDRKTLVARDVPADKIGAVMTEHAINRISKQMRVAYGTKVHSKYVASEVDQYWLRPFADVTLFPERPNYAVYEQT